MIYLYRRAGCPQPAACKFICTIYLVGEHSVLPRYGYMGAWANTVRPYGYTGADCLYGGVRAARPAKKKNHTFMERIK